MLVLGPKKIDVAACNAWSKKGSFSTDATHATTWTQGVIKYEQWKLERKLPMLVLFRRFSKMLVLFGSFPMWSRISHFLLFNSSLFSHNKKLKGKQLERRRRRKRRKEKKEKQSRRSNRSKSAQKQPKMAQNLTHSGATSIYRPF